MSRFSDFVAYWVDTSTTLSATREMPMGLVQWRALERDGGARSACVGMSSTGERLSPYGYSFSIPVVISSAPEPLMVSGGVSDVMSLIPCIAELILLFGSCSRLSSVTCV